MINFLFWRKPKPTSTRIMLTMTIEQLSSYVSAQLATLGLPAESDTGKALAAFVSYVQHQEDVANAVAMLTAAGYTVSAPATATAA
jgi:hypothetical protein